MADELPWLTVHYVIKAPWAHPTPVRTAIIGNTRSEKYWHRCAGKGTGMDCWYKCELVQLPWRAAWRIFKKLKIKLSYDLQLSFLGIYPKEMKALIQKSIFPLVGRMCTHTYSYMYMVISSLSIHPLMDI